MSDRAHPKKTCVIALWLAAVAAGLPGAAPAVAEGAVRGLAVGILTQASGAAGGGARLCSASLIAPDKILTAAHCVFDPGTGQAVRAAALHFRLTRRDGAAVAERDVRALRIARGFRYGRAPRVAALGPDVAVLTLDRPVRLAGYDPLAPAPAPRVGARVEILSHGAGAVPIWQPDCPVLALGDGVMAIDCAPGDGQSGAPVLVADGAGHLRVAGVVSARATVAGRVVLLAVPLPDAELP